MASHHAGGQVMRACLPKAIGGPASDPAPDRHKRSQNRAGVPTRDPPGPDAPYSVRTTSLSRRQVEIGVRHVAAGAHNDRRIGGDGGRHRAMVDLALEGMTGPIQCTWRTRSTPLDGRGAGCRSSWARTATKFRPCRCWSCR